MLLLHHLRLRLRRLPTSGTHHRQLLPKATTYSAHASATASQTSATVTARASDNPMPTLTSLRLSHAHDGAQQHARRIQKQGAPPEQPEALHVSQESAEGEHGGGKRQSHKGMSKRQRDVLAACEGRRSLVATLRHESPDSDQATDALGGYQAAGGANEGRGVVHLQPSLLATRARSETRVRHNVLNA